MNAEHGGMNWQRFTEPLEAFVREAADATPRWAIFCTYECDPELLARELVPPLTKRGRAFRVAVLADAGALQRRMADGAKASGRLNIHAVRMQGRSIFHPKLMFMRAGAKVLVGIGSANLTAGGLGTNLELWTTSSQEHLAAAVVHFLRSLASSSVGLDPAAKRAIERATVGLAARPSPDLWTSLDETFEARLRRSDAGLRGSTAVDVLSPAYASDGGAELLRHLFGRRRVTLWTDRDDIPVGQSCLKVYSPPPMDGTRDEDEEDPASSTNGRMPTCLHAKAYLFASPRGGSTLWFGSANLTSPALRKTVAKGGNVELLVRSPLTPAQTRDLTADLERWFESATPRKSNSKRALGTIPRARGVVLSAELHVSSGAQVLRVHLVAGARAITIVVADKEYTVRVRRGQRVVEVPLSRPLSLGREAGDWVGVVFERVGDDRVPVLINLPHVATEAAATTPAALDLWLDEMMGRWPRLRVSGRRDDGDDEDQSQDDDGDDGHREDGDEWKERERLDEVRHQGWLDQLAVKAAIAKRYISRMEQRGGYREAMRDAILASLLDPAPKHLHPLLRGWFRGRSRKNR